MVIDGGNVRLGGLAGEFIVAHDCLAMLFQMSNACSDSPLSPVAFGSRSVTNVRRR